MSEPHEQLPALGSEVMMPIIQSPTRTTLFPEQVIAATAGSDFLELIFLRNELMLPIQRGRVKSHDGDRAEIEVLNAPITAQLMDIGHVRMTRDTALNLFVSVGRHLIQFHGVSHDEAVNLLTPSSDVAKSPA